MADWKGGGDKKPNWHGRSAAPGRSTRHGWKAGAESTPGTSRRKLGAAVVGLLLLGVTTAIVWWVLLPKNPPKPCLVLLAVNPADQCTTLDAPMDLYGWLGAKLLSAQARERAEHEQAGRWGSFAPHIQVDDAGNPYAIPTTPEDLDTWAKGLRNFDPLIIYVAAHTGTGPEGSFIFAGGKSRLPVKSLIDTLSSPILKDKKKLLLLDSGRLTPNVVYGQLVDDFAGKISSLNDDIAACPNLLVIVGSGPGERGWESEEYQASPLVIAASEALNGVKDVSPNDDLITAIEFFEYVKKRVSEWTRENRPTASTPFLLPEGEAGRQRAAAITLGVVPSKPAAEPKLNTSIAYSELQSRWDQYESLASQFPAPQDYFPRLWRRYGELLIRYEQAVRAGEPGTTAKLALALNACTDALRAKAMPNLDSASSSVALQLSSGLIPAARSALPPGWQTGESVTTPTDAATRLALFLDAARQFQADTRQSPEANRRRLAVAGVLARSFDSDQRPIDIHLPIMAWAFHNAFAHQEEVPALWFEAFELRAMLEQLACAVTVKEQGPRGTAYTERNWGQTRAQLQTLDERLADSIDRLFSNDPSATSGVQRTLEEIRSQATALQAEVDRFNDAIRGTNRRFAETQHHLSWAVEAGGMTADEFNGLQAALLTFRADCIALDEFLNATESDRQRREKIEAALKRILAKDNPLTTLESRHLAAATAQQQDAALQGQWLPKQQLLESAGVPAAIRLRILRASREISSRLLTGSGGQTPGAAAGTQQDRAKLTAIQRGRMALAWLGKELIDAQCERNPALMRYEALDADLLKMSVSGDLDQANVVGKLLADHIRELARTPSVPSTIDPAAERFSRVALVCESDDALEPAAVNQRWRWRSFLHAMAERACRERWYDEREQPYFSVIAEKYYRDADRIMSPLAVPGDDDAQREQQARLLADRKVVINTPLERLIWTSELERKIDFTVNVPADIPVKGRAVAVRRADKLSPLKFGDAQQASVRPIVDMTPGQQVKVETALQSGTTEAVLADCATGLTVYFRGQRPMLELPIRVQRRPDLIISEPLPGSEESGVALAVRASPDLDLGEIVVIIDYSGSMKYGLKNEDYTKDDEYKQKPSKFKLAMESLREVLKTLPYQTRLKIRVFSDRSTGESSRLVYGDKTENSRTTWQPGNLEPLNRLMALLESLEPYGYTPLVDSIIESANSDFSGDRSRTKTIVVLSDGIDQKQGVANDITRMERLSAELYTRFKDTDITLLVVQFAMDQEELDMSRVLFRSLRTHRNPGGVWNAANQRGLQSSLMDALRPKLRLLDGGSGGAPANYPSSGWPARTRDDGTDTRNSLFWSPLLSVPVNRRFTAIPYPSGDRIEADLRVQDGDRLLLELAKVDGRTVVRPDMYADFFQKDRKAATANNSWTLTNSTLSIDDSREPISLRGLLFTERTPAHRQNRFDPTAPIRQTGPEHVWWQIAPALEAAPAIGTITLRRRYAFPAPAWELRAEQWPRDPNQAGQFAAPKIRMYAPERMPTPKMVDVRPGEPASRITTSDGDEIEIHHSLESHPIGPAGERVPCLVVRAMHPPNRPILFRTTQAAGRLNQEHSYFMEAGSYTAKFGPFTAADFRANPLRLEMISVTAMMADGASQVELIPPRPVPGTRLEAEYTPKLGRVETDR